MALIRANSNLQQYSISELKNKFLDAKATSGAFQMV